MLPMLTYPDEQSRSSSFLRSKFHRSVRVMPPKSNVYESAVKPFNRKPFFSFPKTNEFIQGNIRRRLQPFLAKNNDFRSAPSLRGEPPSLLNKNNEFGRPFPRRPPPFLSVSNSPANLPRSGRPPPLFAEGNSSISYRRRQALPPCFAGSDERMPTPFQRHPPLLMEHSVLKKRTLSLLPRDNDKKSSFSHKRRPPPLLMSSVSFSETTCEFSSFPKMPFPRRNQENFIIPPSLLKKRGPVLLKHNPKKVELSSTLKKKAKPVVTCTAKKVKNRKSNKKKIKSYTQLKVISSINFSEVELLLRLESS